MKPSRSVRLVTRVVPPLVAARALRSLCRLRRRPERPFGTPEALGAALGGIRAAIGTSAIATPQLASAPWVGSFEAKRSAVSLFARSVGGRDLALGLGALRAYARHDRAALADFLVFGAVADACDVAATLASWRALPKGTRPLVLAITLSAMGSGLALGVKVHQRA